MRYRLLTRILPLFVAVSLAGSLTPWGPGATATDAAASPAQVLAAGGPAAVLDQAAVPAAGLEFVKVITVPNWATTGAKQASSDILSFDPVRHIMYFPDRVNSAVQAIDTQSNSLVGAINLAAFAPDCPTIVGSRGRACPSGVQVAADLRRLLVTDRGSRVWIFDISGTATPTVPLATLTLPNGAYGSDELEYDPLNHRGYVNNTGFPTGAPGPFETTVVDVVNLVVLGAIPQPASLEQPRFDPVDGFIYNNVGDAHIVQRIDPAQGPIGTVVSSLTTPCTDGPTGIDIDPETNTALAACGDQTLILNLNTTPPAITQQFPQLNGADGLYFDNNDRRWYTGNANNTNPNVDSCPRDTTGATPVVGVFAAGRDNKPAVSLVGGQCSTRNGHSLGVDPYQNTIYVPGRQYPANPSSATTGQPGVVVFRDSTRPAQAPIQQAHALLGSVGGSTTSAVVGFDRQGAQVTVTASAQGLPSGTLVLLITTTVGNEVVNCTRSGATATCTGNLLGDPLISGVATLAVGGVVVARGEIAHGHGPTHL